MGTANILCPLNFFNGGPCPQVPFLPMSLQSILATMDPFSFHLKVNCQYGGPGGVYAKLGGFGVLFLMGHSTVTHVTFGPHSASI